MEPSTVVLKQARKHWQWCGSIEPAKAKTFRTTKGRRSWVMTVPFPSFFDSSVKLSCQCDPRTNLLFWMVYACKAAATTALTCAKRATRGLCTGKAVSASRLWGALFHRTATCGIRGVSTLGPNSWLVHMLIHLQLTSTKSSKVRLKSGCVKP